MWGIAINLKLPLLLGKGQFPNNVYHFNSQYTPLPEKKTTKTYLQKPTSSPASLEIKPWPRDKSTLSLSRCFKSQKGGLHFWHVFPSGPIWMNFIANDSNKTKWLSYISYPWVFQVSWYFASRFRGEIYEVRSKSRRIPLLFWPWIFWEITAMSYHLPWAYLGNLISTGPGEIPGCVGPECPTKVHRKGDVACNFWKLLRWSKVRPNLKLRNKHI